MGHAVAIQVCRKSHQDEMGRGPQCKCMGAENSVFDTTRFTAPKLAIMSGSRLFCDKDVFNLNVCCKPH